MRCLLGQVALGDDRVEQDLDVHLVVGAVDAGRVVDRVHEDPAAAARVGDPGALREAEVAALADDAAAQLLGVDPHGVVRAVADLGVPFVAAPSHTCRCRRSRAGRPERAAARGSARSGVSDFGLDAERRAGLRGERDRLRRPREDAAARRDQRPRRSPPRTSPAGWKSRSRSAKLAAGSGFGVEEDVPMVERADELDVTARAASRCRTHRRTCRRCRRP